MGEIEALAIVGPGLMGSSIALAARRAWPAIEVRLVDRGEPLDAVRGTDIVVLAAPVDAIIATLPQLGPVVSAHALVMDVGSTKRAVIAAASAAGLGRFVGGHPMAGGTKGGAAQARVDLFDQRPWLLMGPDASAEAMAQAAHFVAGLGAVPVVIDDRGERHDHVMAAVSHLPQLTASVLMTVVEASVGADGLQWAGPGLRDTTRLAASPAGLWQSILTTNQDEIRPLLKALAARLDEVADRLGDPDAVARLFADAARARRSCL